MSNVTISEKERVIRIDVGKNTSGESIVFVIKYPEEGTFPLLELSSDAGIFGAIINPNTINVTAKKIPKKFKE